MITTLHNVLAIPSTGIYDCNDQSYLEESFLYRFKKKLSQQFPRLAPTQTFSHNSNLSIEGKAEFIDIDNAFFAGWKIDHFGHFLLESLSRLSHLPAEKTTVVWLAASPKETVFKSWQLDIFKLLGVDHHHHLIISKPRRIHHLIMAEAEYRIWDRFSDQHARFLACYQPSTDVIQGKKIWLSRSAFNIKKGGWINEPAIETLLAEQGWIIYHPEQHSLTDQLAELLSAEVIAGIEGSAFHLLILAQHIQNRVIIFARGHKINPNYELIAAVKQFSQQVITIPRTHIRGQTAHIHSMVNVAQVLKALNGTTQEIPVDVNLPSLTTYIEKSNQAVLVPKMTYKLFKTSAELLEEIDLEKAYQLMLLAQQLNPNGPVIQQKLLTYKEKLDKMMLTSTNSESLEKNE